MTSGVMTPRSLALKQPEKHPGRSTTGRGGTQHRKVGSAGPKLESKQWCGLACTVKANEAH